MIKNIIKNSSRIAIVGDSLSTPRGDSENIACTFLGSICELAKGNVVSFGVGGSKVSNLLSDVEWQRRIENFNPSLVLYHFGMNDSWDLTPSDIYSLMRFTESRKIFSTNILPSTSAKDDHAQFASDNGQEGRNHAAGITRSVCSRLGVDVIDLHRSWLKIVKGSDPFKIDQVTYTTNKQSSKTFIFTAFFSNPQNGDELIFGRGGSSKIKINNGVEFYFNNVKYADSKIGITKNMRFSITQTRCLIDNNLGISDSIKIIRSGASSNPVIKSNSTYKFTSCDIPPDKLTGEELFGKYDGKLSRKEGGGNGINHPNDKYRYLLHNVTL